MSKIEWTEKTWNPIAGCSKVSQGCTHCYAELMAKRLAAMGQEKYKAVINEQGRWNGKIIFDEKALLEPLSRKKPTVYFVNSMSDLFHESILDEWIYKIFAVMALCPQHTFQILTKRPERMHALLSKMTEVSGLSGTRPYPEAAGMIEYNANFLAVKQNIRLPWRKMEGPGYIYGFHADMPWPLSNVWLGVSVENQQAADERIPLLLQTPAAVRFLSCEPLLGPVDLERIPVSGKWDAHHFSAFGGHHDDNYYEADTGIDWVIAGGESGPGARPMHPDWVRSLRDQCQAAQVPFFFKQWGEWWPLSSVKFMDAAPKGRFSCIWLDKNGQFTDIETGSEMMWKTGKSKAGRLLDGRTWDEMPEVVHG